MALVKTPKPTFAQKLKRFFMIDLIKGLGLTLKYNLCALTDKDAVAGKGIYTEQYPKVRPDVAPRFHGAPRLNMDPETHDTLCIACNLCATSCLELTQDFELATYSRAGFVWNREMLEQGRETVKYTS